MRAFDRSLEHSPLAPGYGQIELHSVFTYFVSEHFELHGSESGWVESYAMRVVVVVPVLFPGASGCL